MNSPEIPQQPDWLADLARNATDTTANQSEHPFALTGEGDRLARFKAACPAEFCQRIDRARLTNPAAFDAVAKWDGSFPGPTASGPSGCGKTRAAWSALGRLCVKDGIGFSWWPVRKLITDMADADRGLEGLFYRHSASQIFFVDDIDKINWQFESNAEALFTFYDAAYRRNFPCITTTNRPRDWWEAQMGGPFARRIFEAAGKAVGF